MDVWLSEDNRCVLCNNNSNIPDKMLLKIMKTIEANADDVKAEWEHPEHAGYGVSGLL